MKTVIYEKYNGQNDPQPISITHKAHKGWDFSIADVIEDLEWRVYPHVGSGDSPQYYYSMGVSLPGTCYLEEKLDVFVHSLKNYLRENIDKIEDFSALEEYIEEFVKNNGPAELDFFDENTPIFANDFRDFINLSIDEIYENVNSDENINNGEYCSYEYAKAIYNSLHVDEDDEE